MNDGYLDILKEWETKVVFPVIFDNMDSLFPAYGFRRISGNGGARWISPLKLDLSKPKNPNKEKTVVSEIDLKFREQGEWNEPVGVVDKLMEEYGLGSVYEVCKFIAARFCLDMPLPGGGESKVRDRRQKLLRRLEEYFIWNLGNNSGPMCVKTREYLAGRGFTPEDIRRLGFGFVPKWDSVEKYVTSERFGFTVKELEEVCRVRSEDGFTTVGWKHVLAIPYRCGGETKGFLFRAIEKDVSPKYKANSGLDRKGTFFNMPEGKDTKSVIVVEGEMDALTATAAGIEGVVAIGGSYISGDRRSQIYDAQARGVDEIIIVLDLDVDKDGNPNYEKRFKANLRTIHTILDVNSGFDDIFVVELPYPCDPDEYIRKNGPDSFLELVENALPWWQYLYEYKVSNT